ncbi:reverse gyrase [Nautilia profundicola AmH]|uniref:Reverse gyrase n=1 Tax=Nautilia profundicola (strain ATCC BAA-1463 / DSM 18972 / AmH) TaxID=598659 RepID=B9LA13_NAUPA|nr:reverse gyrase [Nautilia profundicola]ACM92181.1 reverse gyrase [Nautilia profundicola AmH]
MLHIIYKNECPRCGGDISSVNLNKGMFCDECMKSKKKEWNLENCENLLNYEKYCIADKKVNEFNEFFKFKCGNELNSIQKMWAKRFFLDNSFALLASTGIGKTTFGLLLSAFVKNSYILFPTKLLVAQAAEKYKKWGIEFVAYMGKKSEKELIEKGEYDILITTTQFLYKNRSLIKRNFELIFVDDVDSILKSGKKIADILTLLGIDKNSIEKTYELIKNQKYSEIKSVSKKGNLIVSSATANPKSKKILLFKYLLGFEVSRPNFNLRNIEDLYDENYSWDHSVKWINELGRGGLLFLPGNETKDTLYEYIDFLNTKNIKAYSYEDFEKHLEEFKEGKCFFVGFASYKNPLARGIDLPEYIKYTLFVGVPKIEFNLKDENFRAFYFIMLSLLPYLVKNNLSQKEVSEIQNDLNYLKKYIYLSKINVNTQQKIADILIRFKNTVKKYEDIIKTAENISFDGEKFIIADVTGYIQASGRSSRFYKGHLTKGLSLLLVDNKKAFYSLKKKLKWFGEIEFKNVEDVDIKKVLTEIEKSRTENVKTEFKTSFVIVESPTKAKTISSFFGNPSKRIINNVAVYEVLSQDRVLIIAASIGHDFDLVKDEGVWGVKDLIPIFHVLENKDKILQTLNINANEVEEVYAATDPDREGEKIAFDLTMINKPYNMNIKRIEFHEITKQAFEEALSIPREIDLNLVKSQLFRRITDRWVGFKISLYLQRLLNNTHLSAGRVQTPVLKWICERTGLLKEKIYVVIIRFNNVSIDFEFDTKQEANEFFNSLKESVYIKKLSSNTEVMFEKPFNTPDLLKEASNKLRFSPQKTMQLAQELFEKGFITYHRTDSYRISDTGKAIAKTYILENFSKDYLKFRNFESKGAHEAIRATTSMDADELRSYMLERNILLSEEHLRLYDLIFRKFIASQMKEAKVLKEKFLILLKEKSFITEIVENGYNLIYPINIYIISEGENKIVKELRQKPKAAPYTYAEVIEEMRSKGIGRPSTYAIIIEKLLKRKYITDKNGYLFATKLGFRIIKEVYKSDFKDFVSEEFTAELENIMDKIEEGKTEYEKELKKLFSLLF